MEIPENKEPNKFEQSMDMYDGMGELADYYNEYVNITAIININRRKKGIAKETELTIEEVQEAIKENSVQTFEERYLKYGPDNDYVIDMEKQRVKVDRLNVIAKMINEVDNLTTYKQLVNEGVRMLYGKDRELTYPEPEFNPDFLKI